MVATRSQDRDSHVHPVEESQIPSEIDSPIPSNSKRKVHENAAVMSTPSFSTKRRKLNDAPSTANNDTPKTFAAVVIPTITSDSANDKEQTSSNSNVSKLAHEDGINASSQGSDNNSPGAGRVSMTGVDTISNQEKGGSKSQKPAGFEDSTMNDFITPMSTRTAPPMAGSNAKKLRQKDKRKEITPLDDPLPAISFHSDDKPNKSQHKRFEGYDDISPSPTSPSVDLPPENPSMLDTIQDSGMDISEDDAPDVVSQSTGLQKARSTAAETAKAIEAQRAVEKQKRKERNQLLERQAKAVKREVQKKKPKGIRSKMLADDDRVDREPASPRDYPAEFQWSSEDALPELLPDEILAAEPMVRFPTPESLIVRAPTNKKQRFLDKTSKPPKDIRKGNVRIRVLEEKQATLAPKVSKPSQRIKESWLAGRPGAKGRVVMERRKMGGGFVRR